MKFYGPGSGDLRLSFDGLITENFEGEIGFNIIDELNATDFYEAPASTKYHNSCPYGLIAHTLNVVEAGKIICDSFSHSDYKKSVIRTALLHDICKADFYKEGVKNVKTYLPYGASPIRGVKLQQDTGGTFYWKPTPFYTIDESFLYGHGEKSVYLALQYGADLTPAEAQAIRYHMGDFNKNPETTAVYTKNPVALILHMADLYASSYLDFNSEQSAAFFESLR